MKCYSFEKCPFCGEERRLLINTRSVELPDDRAVISCPCGAHMEACGEPETYIPIDEKCDLYRRIPSRSAIDVLKEKWNRRDGV